MSQFGGAKNMPWGRPNPGAGQQLNPQLFTGQLGQMGLAGAAQQFALPQAAAMHLNAAQLGMAGLSGMTGLPVNAAAFTSQAAPQGLSAMNNAVSTMSNLSRGAVPAQQQQQQQQSVAGQKNTRAFVGLVTKMQDNYGFVDDDVFFQTTVVRGAMPRVGERVMVEANYNPNMPFKWNAFRIQLLHNQEQPTTNNAQPSTGRTREERWGPPSDSSQSRSTAGIDFARQLRDRSPARRRERSPPPRRPSPPRRSPPPPRRRSPSPRRQSSVLSSSSNLKRDRTRSPTRDRESPPRRRARLAPPSRYVTGVMLPKTSLDTREMTSYWLRKNMTSMYIPSDFFSAQSHWHTAFPLDRPFDLAHPCSFQVMHKEVDPVSEKVAILDPPDADYRFSAKVMLMANPGLPELYKKTLGLGDDEIINDSGCVTPQRAINFLVGVRGKSEVVSIGGPWSPSLDGADPEGDPRVLIRTATRTCLALTGVDLSGCTQWYKYVELRYRRVEKEKDGDPPRVEVVVVFLPDVWSVAPTKTHAEHTQTLLKKQLETKMEEIDKPPPEVTTPIHSPVPHPPQEEPETPETTPSSAADDTKGEPTPWNQLDLKSMKVTELRAELVARGLDSKGVKAALSTRLLKALKEEEEKEKLETEEKPAEEEKAEEKKEGEKMDEDIQEIVQVEKVKEKTKEELEAEEKEKQKVKDKEEKEKKEKKAALEKHYAVSSTPGILVFPHKTAKGGKFECKILSLHQLLDYRQEDNKEHSFEVAVFAEAFYEMICRDAAFNVYKTLLAAPDKDYEEKKKKEEEEAMKKLEEEAAKIAEEAKKAAEAKKAEEGKKDEEEKTETEGAGEESMDITESPEIKEIVPAKEDKKEEKVKESPKKDDKKPERRSRSKEREEAKKLQPVVRCADRLWAFTVFDQGRDGRIPDKDAEEILLSLGLKLSRAQVQRIVRRVSVRDHIQYKQYVETIINKDTKAVKKEPLLFPIPHDKQLALGNCAYASSVGEEKMTSESMESPTVLYQGAVVDVAQIVAQLQKMDKEHNSLIIKNTSLEKELKSSKDRQSTLEKKKTRLDEDLSKYKKRLNDAEKCLKTSQDDTVQLKTALMDSKKLSERITRTVDKAMPDLKKSKKDDKKAESSDDKKEKKEGSETSSKKEEESATENNSTKEESKEASVFKEPEPVVENANSQENENSQDGTNETKE